MHRYRFVGGRLVRSAVAASAVAVLAMQSGVPAAAGEAEGAFLQTNLVSNVAGLAPVFDKNLKNPWGLSASPSSPVWVSDNNAGVSTLYRGDGTKVPLVVTIQPAHGPSSDTGSPTGTVFSGTSDFVITKGGKSGGSVFLFATEDGTIQGWNPGVDPFNAVPGVDNGQDGALTGAVYKGLALASVSGHNFLYASNFRSAKVDVFNSQFQQQTWVDAFRDRHIPAGYAPFGIQNLNGWLYVTYAVQNALKHDDVSGAGHGFVDVFTPSGQLVRRLIRHGALNSPWGLAIAPASWGDFAGDLLVGNFRDGRINAYSQRGHFRGALADQDGQPISIDGLWGLRFGNGGGGTPDGAHKADPNALYFAAGINGENDGLFGTITVAPEGDD